MFVVLCSGLCRVVSCFCLLCYIELCLSYYVQVYVVLCCAFVYFAILNCVCCIVFWSMSCCVVLLFTLLY